MIQPYWHAIHLEQVSMIGYVHICETCQRIARLLIHNFSIAISASVYTITMTSFGEGKFIDDPRLRGRSAVFRIRFSQIKKRAG